jgi:hypothetical protein
VTHDLRFPWVGLGFYIGDDLRSGESENRDIGYLQAGLKDYKLML